MLTFSGASISIRFALWLFTRLAAMSPLPTILAADKKGDSSAGINMAIFSGRDEASLTKGLS